jgi:hypothetical protein
MPTPSSSLSTLRPDLGSMLEFDLMANRAKFIANRILPILNVEQAADKYGKIPLEQLLKRANVKRGPKGNYNRVDWSFTDASYATREYGLEGAVDQNNARTYANYIDAEAATAQLVLHMVQLEAEIRVRDKLFPGSYAPTAVDNEWSDPASGTPIDDVDAAVLRIFVATGIWPNAIVFNKKVFRNLRKTDQILDRIAAQGAGDKIKAKDVTVAMIAACFDLDHVIVAEGVTNTADEGQTAVPGHIWGDEYAAVGRIAETQSIIEPCLGHTFHWAGDGSEPGGLVETYYEEQNRGDVVRVRHQVDDENLKYTEMWDVLSNITE